MPSRERGGLAVLWLCWCSNPLPPGRATALLARPGALPLWLVKNPQTDSETVIRDTNKGVAEEGFYQSIEILWQISASTWAGRQRNALQQRFQLPN